MKISDIEQLAFAFSAELSKYTYRAEDLDYSIFEKQIPILQSLATISNSGVSVFDLNKKEHLFYSPNFGVLLGYDLKEILERGQEFLDQKIFTDDYVSLMKNGILLFKLFNQFSDDEKANYKLINEYRVLNSDNKYVRVIEQHQSLQMDARGNMWLIMSTIDISPNQESNDVFKSQLLNFRTGKTIPILDDSKNLSEDISLGLTKREVQILQLVKDGFLSKEISDKLAISVHTVNTHRQRFLEKLGANNSMEAVVFASKLGLL
jgi:DNA-binding CsgD family transcriptional regulator